MPNVNLQFPGSSLSSTPRQRDCPESLKALGTPTQVARARDVGKEIGLFTSGASDQLIKFYLETVMKAPNSGKRQSLKPTTLGDETALAEELLVIERMKQATASTAAAAESAKRAQAALQRQRDEQRHVHPERETPPRPIWLLDAAGRPVPYQYTSAVVPPP